MAAHSLIRGSEGRREGGVSPATAQGRKAPEREEPTASRATGEGGRVGRRDVRGANGRGVRIRASRRVRPIAAPLYSKESRRRVVMRRRAHGDCSRFGGLKCDEKVADGS